MLHLSRPHLAFAVCALLLAGCGEDPATTAHSTSPTAPLRLAVIPKGNSHAFWQSVKQGAEAAAAELGNVELEFRGPAKENDATLQKELLQLQVGKGVDGVAVAPVDGTGLAPAIDEAAAQVPVVIFDSGTTATGHGSFVATDNYAAGKLAGEAMRERLGGRGKIVVLRYKAGSSSTENREQGFIEVIEAAPEMTIISADQEGAGREKEVAQILLSRFGKQLDGIFTPNQSTTIDMITALREGGYYDRDIVHVGFDNSVEILQSLKDGEIDAYVVQDPVQMGYRTVKSLHALISGEEVEKQQPIPAALVTKDRLQDPDIQALVR